MNLRVLLEKESEEKTSSPNSLAICLMFDQYGEKGSASNGLWATYDTCLGGYSAQYSACFHLTAVN